MAKRLFHGVEELAASVRRVWYGTLELLSDLEGELLPEAPSPEEWLLWKRLTEAAPAILEACEGMQYREAAVSLASSLPADDPLVSRVFGPIAARTKPEDMLCAWDFATRHLTAALDEPDDADSLDDLEALWSRQAIGVRLLAQRAKRMEAAIA